MHSYAVEESLPAAESLRWHVRGVSCSFHDSTVFLCAKAEDADD
jgi:hypothetical protein